MSLVPIRRRFQTKLLSEEERCSAIYPVMAYDAEDKLFLTDDKSLGFSFMCSPLVGASEKIQERVNGLLNQEFPAGAVLQFILYRSPDMELDLHEMASIRDGFNHDLLSSVIKERIKFLDSHSRRSLISRTDKGFYDSGLIQDLKLVVTCKLPISGYKPSEEDMQQAKQTLTKVESALQTVGMRPRTMDAAALIRFTSSMLNWGESPSWKSEPVSDWDETRPICEQVFDYDTSIEWEKGDLQIGKQHVRVLSAKRLPKFYYFGDALAYVGDISGGSSSVKENYAIVCNVFIPQAEKTKAALERKRQLAVNQAYGPLLKFVPILADKKQGMDVLYESMNEGAKPISMSYSMVVFAPTKQRADTAAMAARNLWRELRFTMLEDRFIELPMFINCLPLGVNRKDVRDTFRFATMTTEQASPLLPIFGEWKGTGTYHASLLSRNGQLMSLSLHDSNTNKNLVVAAESGSGKSFLMNELITSYLSEGAQVWVIDAGKSYQKLSEMLGGDFLHFEEGTDICMNPFELIENYDDEEDSIVSLVSSMASAKGLLKEWQVASLKQVMSQVWAEKGKSMKVDDIADKCLAADDQRLKDIGMQLFPFTAKGNYGRYFSGDNNVNFKKQFTVLELDELQGRKHLRQVILLQLIYQIQQEVYLGERDRKKIVFVDEAWDLMKEGEVSVFMEHSYRKFRKYGGSMGISTQSINDLYENAVGRAVAENSASMYLLGQTEETVESVKRSGRLSLPDGLFGALRTVHTVAGVYSEIFVKSKTGMGIGRLIVSDFQKLLYSTDPVDVHAIDQYVKAGLSISDAIRSVMRDRGQLEQSKGAA